MQLLLTVTDTRYNSSDKKHLVLTGTTDRTIRYADKAMMEIRVPSGKTFQLPARAVFLDPSPKGIVAVAFEGLTKDDVPIGSEVWLLENQEPKPYTQLKKFPGSKA